MTDQKRIEIQTAKPGDVDGILALDNLVWKDFPASRDMIERRVAKFPEGNFIAIDLSDPENAKIVGYLCLMFVGHKPSEFPNSWNDITGDGTIRTHNPDGEYMYGVALTVAPGYDIGMKLQIYGWATVVKYDKRGCYLGSPIPGFGAFHRKHPEVSVEEYVFDRKRKNRPFDQELAYYRSAGFKAVRVLPNYEPDPKSLDYGVLVYQPNIFHRWPFRYKAFRWLIAWLVKKYGFKLLKKLGI